MSALLDVAGVSVRYRKGGQLITAVNDVSFTVDAGERVGLVGTSGSGKSTLLRACLGLEPLAAGQIRFAGEPVQGASKALRRRFQPVFQDSTSALDPRWTCFESLAEPLALHGLPHDEAVLTAQLAQVQLPASVGPRRPHELSAGQRQRVCLARALCLSPELLVLDEPVSALDVSVQAQIIELLETVARERRLSMVLVSHDLAVVKHLCTKVLVIEAGRLVS